MYYILVSNYFAKDLREAIHDVFVKLSTREMLSKVLFTQNFLHCTIWYTQGVCHLNLENGVVSVMQFSKHITMSTTPMCDNGNMRSGWV